MGEYTKRETEIAEYIVREINSEIFGIEERERDRGWLDYSLCSNYAEKQNINVEKMAKFRSKIDKCDPEITIYLVELAKPTPKGIDFYDYRDSITKNFVYGSCYELIQDLAEIDDEKLDRLTFSSLVKSAGHKYKPIKNYIKGVCDLNHYQNYKLFLEISQDENINYDNIIEKINNAFFRLESFMNGSISEYYYFDFNTAFTELFYSTRLVYNFTPENCKRIGQYWELSEQISTDYQKSDFVNLKAYENKAFCGDCDALTSIYWHRVEEFVNFQTADEIEKATKKKSILNLIKTSPDIPIVNEDSLINKSTSVNNEENPYPRIFKDFYSYAVFKRLHEEFGNTKENLSNYSFVFHRMTYEGLIHYDLLHKTYIGMLSEFDISLDRLKSIGDIGKKAYRESIYTAAK